MKELIDKIRKLELTNNSLLVIEDKDGTVSHDSLNQLRIFLNTHMSFDFKVPILLLSGDASFRTMDKDEAVKILKCITESEGLN